MHVMHVPAYKIEIVTGAHGTDCKSVVCVSTRKCPNPNPSTKYILSCILQPLITPSLEAQISISKERTRPHTGTRTRISQLQDLGPLTPRTAQGLERHHVLVEKENS